MQIVKVEGMKCQHCVGSVKKALEEIKGVSGVVVDLDKGQASFEGEVSVDLVKEAIVSKGFVVVD